MDSTAALSLGSCFFVCGHRAGSFRADPAPDDLAGIDWFRRPGGRIGRLDVEDGWDDIGLDPTGGVYLVAA
jgi:hypothetical protein